MVADYLNSLGMGIIFYFIFLFPFLCITIGLLCGWMKIKSWKTTMGTVFLFLVLFSAYSWVMNQGESSGGFLVTAPFEYLIYYGGLTFGANQLVLSLRVKKAEL